MYQVWINQGDIILVGLRDYQDAKADVILKYNPDEARNLKSYGELPEYAKINENVGGQFGDDEDEDNIIEFGEVSSDEESDIDNVSHPLLIVHSTLITLLSILSILTCRSNLGVSYFNWRAFTHS